MAISIVGLSSFRTIFCGSLEAYGLHTYTDQNKKGEKERGMNATKIGLVSDRVYENHLNGKQGLGIIPIRKDGTCLFVVIDIDMYGQETLPYIKIVYKNNFPLVPFRSKSGGLHLYMFFTEPLKVRTALNFLTSLKTLLTLSKKVEMFPKQVILKGEQIGNWINLPYFNAEKTKQYLYDEELKPVLFEEAMLIIKKRTYTEKQLNEFIETLDLFDAPPCLQSIYYSGETDFRNEYLFSLACYFKSKYSEEFEDRIKEANDFLNLPIEESRLTRTIIASHRKKEYTYRCSDQPLEDLCNRVICRERKYGIGGGEISELSYGTFIKFTTDPPYYEWIVNEKSLKFFNEIDIINQDKFRELCFRELHILPTKLKMQNWTKIVNQALKNIVLKDINVEDDISPGTLFKEYLLEFLEKRATAQSKKQILIDRVFKDDEIESYIFKAKNFIHFIYYQKRFRAYSPTEIQDKLRQLSGYPKRYFIDKKNKGIRVWILPFSGLEKFIDETVHDEFEIDFKEEYEDEPY